MTTFGESHGPAMGVIVDGCPAGLDFDQNQLVNDLARRRPGQSDITTQRKELDDPKVISGIIDGKTTGHPICVLVENSDFKSEDYQHTESSFRPSHADFTYHSKFGIRDHRGGGRSSARETLNWVAAGAVAKCLLKTEDIRIAAYVHSIGSNKVNDDYRDLDLSNVENNEVRCPDPDVAEKMISEIKEVRDAGDTLGGIVGCVVENVPVGLGEPIFSKLHADLGQAMLTINAVKGFEFGSGFNAPAMKGSEHNDVFEKEGGKISTRTNHSGGIQGGISNGEDIYFKVAFKPVSTIMKDQETVDGEGKEVTIEGKGRHDPCVVPRAVPIVEAMTALVLADHYLINRVRKI